MFITKLYTGAEHIVVMKMGKKYHYFSIQTDGSIIFLTNDAKRKHNPFDETTGIKNHSEILLQFLYITNVITFFAFL